MNDLNQKISKTRLTLGFGLIFLTFISIFLYFNHKKYYPSTDDAYVRALLVNVTPKINGTIKNKISHDNPGNRSKMKSLLLTPQLVNVGSFSSIHFTSLRYEASIRVQVSWII